MADEIKAGEMSAEQPEQGAEQHAQDSAEMVQVSAAELAEIRAALKKANGEAAKFRKIADQVEADRKQKEQAEMTELQKLQAAAADLEKQLAAERRTRLQGEIAAKVGLPAVLASRLVGDDAEAMEADAKALLETLPKPKPTNPGASNPGMGGQVETREQQRTRLLGENRQNPLEGGGVIWRRPPPD